MELSTTTKKTILKETINMKTNQEIIEVAQQHGMENWLEAGTKGWYTCIITGKKFRGAAAKEILATMEEVKEEIERNDNQEEYQAEEIVTKEDSKMTERLQVHIAERVVNGKAKGIKLITINCEDCGAEREIKVQDAFQVKRCKNCQKKHRNKLRNEKRKEKRKQQLEAAKTE